MALSQAQVIPYLLETEENLCIAMSSGCGKTLIYAIGAITKVDRTKNKPQVLCVCVSYEAAIQTAKILNQIAIFTGVKVGLATNEIGYALKS